MAENNFISGTSTELLDGNLLINDSVNEGRSILIIGTAKQGPVNKPVKINNMEEAKQVFGSIYNGSGLREETLLTGADIIFQSGDSQKDVRMVRISNGETSSVELKERMPQGVSSADVNQKTALKLTALYPGEIYNQVTIKQSIINGESCIEIYNPLTGESSLFPFMLNANGNIRNVIDLARAINADENLYTILKAEATYYNVKNTEITMYSAVEGSEENVGNLITTGDNPDITVGNGYYEINLNNMYKNRKDGDTGKIEEYDDTNHNDPASLINPGLNDEGNAEYEINSSSNIATIAEIYKNEEYAFTKDNVLKADGLVVVNLPYPTQVNNENKSLGIKGGKAKQVKKDYQIGVTDGINTVFSFSAYEAIDSNTVELYKVTVNGQKKLVDSSIYELTVVGGEANNNVATIELLDATSIEPNVTLIISYESEEFDLTQVFSKADVNASGSYKTYYMVGSRIFFGAQSNADLEFTYFAKKVYDSSSYTLIDSAKGVIRINETFEPVTEEQQETQIFITWTYLPDWLDIASKIYTLSGGTNGSTFSNAVKYTLLDELYTKLSDYEVQIVYLPLTYADDTKVVESDDDGLPIEVNAGFLQQMNNYVNGLAIGYKDAVGVMGMKPCYRAEDVPSWINNLINTSIYYPNRAANLMAVRNYKRCVVTAGTVLVGSDNVNPYITGIDGFVAAELTSLPVNKTLTNKTFNSYYSMVMPFDIPSEAVKKINDYQYTTIKKDNDGTVRIAEGFTASAIGSDYKRLSTLMTCLELANIARDTIKPYIGEYFGDVQKTSLETQLTSAFQVLTDTSKGEAPAKTINFELTQTLAQKKEGICELAYTMVPNFELVKVRGKIKLSLQ